MVHRARLRLLPVLLWVVFMVVGGVAGAAVVTSQQASQPAGQSLWHVVAFAEKKKSRANKKQAPEPHGACRCLPLLLAAVCESDGGGAVAVV